jgi:hypothetical protein
MSTYSGKLERILRLARDVSGAAPPTRRASGRVGSNIPPLEEQKEKSKKCWS